MTAVSTERAELQQELPLPPQHLSPGASNAGGQGPEGRARATATQQGSFWGQGDFVAKVVSKHPSGLPRGGYQRNV